MELHVLRVENTAELVQRLVQIRSQYAVILALAGEHKRAESQMRRLEPYFEGLTGYQQQEVEDQSTIITHLAFEVAQSKSTKYSGPAVEMNHARVAWEKNIKMSWSLIARLTMLDEVWKCSEMAGC